MVLVSDIGQIVISCELRDIGLNVISQDVVMLCVRASAKEESSFHFHFSVDYLFSACRGAGPPRKRMPSTAAKRLRLLISGSCPPHATCPWVTP